MLELAAATFDLPEILRPFVPTLRALGLSFAWWLLLQWTVGVLLVAAVAVTLRRMTRLNAATRTLVWSLTLLTLALLPLLALQIERTAAPWAGVPEETQSVSWVASATPPSAVPLARPSAAGPRGDRGERLGRLPSALWAVVLAVTAAAWLCWALLRAVRLACSVLWLFVLRLRSRVDEGTSARVERLASTAGVRWAPVVRRAPVAGPCCVGLARPWIALPAAAASGSTASDDAPADEVLLHELAHSARRDGLTGFLVQLSRVVLVGSPVADWVARRIACERESACDDWVVGRTGEPVRYGRVLLAEAERAAGRWGNARRTPALAPGMADSGISSRNNSTQRRSELRERMERMFDSRRHHGPKVSGTVTLICVGALALGSYGFAWAWPNAPELRLQGLIAWNAEEGFSYPRLNADDAPLYRAIRSGDYDEVAQLLADGEDPRQIWPGDGSPLIVAARRGALDVAQLLIDSGAEVDHSVSGDGSPLVAAVQSGHVEVVELLLANGADVDFSPGNGDGSPLIAASLRGHVDTVNLLLDRGARVDAYVVGDDTPLINAAQQGNLGVFQCLMRAGADPSLTGDYDYVLGEQRTALNQARANGHDVIVGVLDGSIPLESISEDDC